MNQIPELQQLLSEVESTFGHPLNSSKDFFNLSVSIGLKVKDTLGATTLKRLWGYINHSTLPRFSTLEILSKYAGYENFKQFKEGLHAEESSVYLYGENILMSEELSQGDCIMIGWLPDRLAKLEYLGEDMFLVKEVENSKLLPGDKFEVTYFCKGWPLFVPGIIRDGETTPPYVAGKSKGLNLIRKI
ncbi:MAG: hypothetical protein IJL91_08135 [Bacteroidales bacterium]|nr:hypothetical protein [Bacteroidales bacterium]